MATDKMSLSASSANGNKPSVSPGRSAGGGEPRHLPRVPSRPSIGTHLAIVTQEMEQLNWRAPGLVRVDKPNSGSVEGHSHDHITLPWCSPRWLQSWKGRSQQRPDVVEAQDLGSGALYHSWAEPQDNLCCPVTNSNVSFRSNIAKFVLG
ncbi:hypothetical protein EYF80_013374 [Liparis tanakae]|uniref:Uncharacterized protein n=1 Tax=Liparis tanakae TaxID=230148 RepID=A0A4Z2IEH3_9TELE|nr:hypothetical protein EYF80_013374 [Liparis tanakae]